MSRPGTACRQKGWQAALTALLATPARAATPSTPMAPDDQLRRALARLADWLASQREVVVAYSGGMDSGLLALVATATLPERTRVLTVVSEFVATAERARARELATRFGLPLEELAISVLADPKLAANPPDRCYRCKTRIVAAIRATMRPEEVLVEGSQQDDLADDRPGWRALQEGGVASPLLAAGFTKDLVAAALTAIDAAAFIAPAQPCLATRFPFGVTLSPAALARVGTAEERLRRLGFPVIRVRDHGAIARLEVPAADLAPAVARRQDVLSALADLSYQHVTLDLAGYRRGGAAPKGDR